MKDIEAYKTNSYKKNVNLESLLSEINEIIRDDKVQEFDGVSLPIIFIVGTPRSGTTLMSQWLSSLKLFNYPTNFISRFYKNPYAGFLIQEMLFNEDYRYKNELEFSLNNQKFISDVGKTNGPLEPHEFWYFWREHFSFPDEPLTNFEFSKNADFNSFRYEISKIQKCNGNPFFLKSLIANFYIESFYKNISNSIFIYIKRDIVDNAKSLLNIRKKYLNDEEKWFSFKPKEYNELSKLCKYSQVVGQVHYTNKAIEEQLVNVPDTNKIVVKYEEFCENPEMYFMKLKDVLSSNNYLINSSYDGVEKFTYKKNISELDDILKKIKFE